jgi:hypothetical protein
MIDLSKDFGIILMNGVGQFFVTGNLIIIPQPGNKLIAHGMLADGIIFGNNQAPAALGLGFVIGNITIGGGAVFIAVIGHHGGDCQTIGNLTLIDFLWCKQFSKHFVPRFHIWIYS